MKERGAPNRSASTGGAPLARWTVARSADGRHHRLTVETIDGRRMRGMLTTPARRAILLTDFACRHLPLAIIDVNPMLERFRKLQNGAAPAPGDHAQWTYARTYGPLRWSLTLHWDGVAPPELVFRHQAATPIAFALEDAAFLFVALPAALQGCMAEMKIDALRSDDAPQTAEPAPAGAAGKRWSTDEEETVWRLWDEGRSLDEIAQLLQRAPGAIASRFSRFNPADR